MTLYEESTVTRLSFADAFLRKNVAHDYDVMMTFENLPSKPFCLQKFGVRKGLF